MALRSSILALVLLVLLAPLAAQARNTDHVLPVKSAVESDVGRSKLLDVPFYFAGQSHPAVAEDLGEVRSNRSSHGVFRSDEDSCQVALLSALIQLQQRANQQGADAIVDIESITKHRNLSSPTEYRCIAGNVVVHVALKGRLVKFGE